MNIMRSDAVAEDVTASVHQISTAIDSIVMEANRTDNLEGLDLGQEKDLEQILARSAIIRELRSIRDDLGNALGYDRLSEVFKEVATAAPATLARKSAPRPVSGVFDPVVAAPSTKYPTKPWKWDFHAHSRDHDAYLSIRDDGMYLLAGSIVPAVARDMSAKQRGARSDALSKNCRRHSSSTLVLTRDIRLTGLAQVNAVAFGTRAMTQRWKAAAGQAYYGSDRRKAKGAMRDAVARLPGFVNLTENLGADIARIGQNIYGCLVPTSQSRLEVEFFSITARQATHMKRFDNDPQIAVFAYGNLLGFPLSRLGDWGDRILEDAMIAVRSVNGRLVVRNHKGGGIIPYEIMSRATTSMKTIAEFEKGKSE